MRDAPTRHRRDVDFTRPGRQEQSGTRTEAPSELYPVGVGHDVPDHGAPVAVGEDLARGLVVHHRREAREVRVRAHPRDVVGSEARHGSRGADGMAEDRDDPDAPIAARLVGQVLGALVTLRHATPTLDGALEATGDDGARMEAQALAELCVRIGHAAHACERGAADRARRQHDDARSHVDLRVGRAGRRRGPRPGRLWRASRRARSASPERPRRRARRLRRPAARRS